MLYLNPTPRLAAFTLLRTFVWPWDSVPLAGVVLVLATLGGVLLMLQERRTLAAVAAISVPYLAFHLAFQDTTFARYALPLVWPVAFLAAVALDAAGRAGAIAALALAGWSLSIAVPAAVGLRRRRQPDVAALRPGGRRLGRSGAAAGAGHAPGARPSARSRAAADRRAPGGATAAGVARAGALLAVGRRRPGVVPRRFATHRSRAGRSPGAARRGVLRLGPLEPLGTGRDAARRRPVVSPG